MPYNTLFQVTLPGFFNRGKPYDQTLAKADRFLVELGWLPAGK
ncbi:hypothetical protein [Haloferula sp. A504]